LSDRCILGVKYTAVTPKAGTQIGGFLKYVQHRDRHGDLPPKVEGLLKYVAHRARSAAKGLLFDGNGRAGDYERRALAALIARSVEGTTPQLTRDADGNLVDRRRAAYRFVLSPEHAAGLDLKQLTRAAMAQLELDAGGVVPWIGAEHRNTAHPHVHIVVAARREVSPGQYRGVSLTRARLQRMKDAIALELERQRTREPRHHTLQVSPAPSTPMRPNHPWSPRHRGSHRRVAALAAARPRLVASLGAPVSLTALRLRRLGRQYHWEAEREAERALLERSRERER
jgi:hypothetical protein